MNIVVPTLNQIAFLLGFIALIAIPLAIVISSMFIYRYEALLKIDENKYREDILSDIERVYIHMLRNGATSFWETIKG